MKREYTSEFGGIQYKDTKYIRRQSRSLSEERLAFRNGERLGDVSISIESGKTLRMVRRIVEKRVCQDYWNQREYGLQLLCEDLYVRDDNTCFVLSLKNGGGVSYETGDTTFVIESRKKGKRSIQYERNLYTKERSGSLSASPGITSRNLYRFSRVTAPPDRVPTVHMFSLFAQYYYIS